MPAVFSRSKDQELMQTIYLRGGRPGKTLVECARLDDPNVLEPD